MVGIKSTRRWNYAGNFQLQIKSKNVKSVQSFNNMWNRYGTYSKLFAPTLKMLLILFWGDKNSHFQSFSILHKGARNIRDQFELSTRYVEKTNIHVLEAGVLICWYWIGTTNQCNSTTVIFIRVIPLKYKEARLWWV